MIARTILDSPDDRPGNLFPGRKRSFRASARKRCEWGRMPRLYPSVR